MTSIFKISKFFMIITGLWKLSFTNNPMLSKLYKVYSIALHSIFGTFSLSLLIRFVELIKSHAKSDTLFGSLTLAIIITMMFYKILIYLKNGIPYLFAEVIKEEKLNLESDDQEIVETYLSQVAYFKWTICTQIICTFFTVAVFIVSNIHKKINDSFKEGEVFMYEIWFPLDKNNHDTLISLFDVCMVSIGFFNNVAVASVPHTLMIYVSVQLRILQIRIRKVFSCHATNEEIVAFLKDKELIKKHQHIIEFLTKLNDGIKNVILIEYILDSVNVAAALLHIITVEFSGEMIFSIFHFSLLLVQIFILAWTANDINTQSLNVGNAIYESLWINQEKPIKQLLHIMLMRAQKPLAISIGPFRQMNIEASLITLKGAYSYASLMIQNYNK